MQKLARARLSPIGEVVVVILAVISSFLPVYILAKLIHPVTEHHIPTIHEWEMEHLEHGDHGQFDFHNGDIDEMFFKLHDINHDGQLDAEEIRHMFQEDEDHHHAEKEYHHELLDDLIQDDWYPHHADDNHAYYDTESSYWQWEMKHYVELHDDHIAEIMGHTTSAALIRAAFGDIDNDHNEYISLKEWLNAVHNTMTIEEYDIHGAISNFLTEHFEQNPQPEVEFVVKPHSSTAHEQSASMSQADPSNAVSSSASSDDLMPQNVGKSSSWFRFISLIK